MSKPESSKLLQWLSLLFWFAVAVVLLLAAGPGCGVETRTVGNDERTQPESWTRGTVVYVDLEGGFFGIIGDDGISYLPKELDPRFQQDRLRVKFHGNTDAEWVSVYMWGKPIIVTDISEE